MTNSNWAPKNLGREVVVQQALGNRLRREKVQEHRFDQASFRTKEMSQIELATFGSTYELSLGQSQRSERRAVIKESYVQTNILKLGRNSFGYLNAYK